MKIDTLADIQRLLDDQIGESLFLEYKKELGNNNEIAKDISAFANTLGGRIIYGIDEKNGIPISINWINAKGIKEKIENIISSGIETKMEGYNIYPIVDSNNSSQAIFVVEILESSELHMANHRYYKRYNFKSEPMDDYEVKNQMFRKGLKKALNFEIFKNSELSKSTLKYLEPMRQVDQELHKKRGSVQLIPFYTDAWKSVVNSGLLFIFKEKASILVTVYSLIHEINYIIDHRSLDENIITPICEIKELEQETMVSSILEDKIKVLRDALKNLSF